MDSDGLDEDEVCLCGECWADGDEVAFAKVEALKIPKQIDISLKNFSGLGEKLTDQAEGMFDFLNDGYGDDLPFVVSLALKRSYYAEYRITGAINSTLSADRYSTHTEDAVSKRFRDDTPISNAIDEQNLLNALGVLIASRAAELQSEGRTQLAFDAIFQSQFLFSYSVLLSAIDAQIEGMKSSKIESLSAAGLMGAMSRKNRYEPIKQWALGKAGNMRGAHKQIARQLSAALPNHLADISDDPERLIYDTLRTNRKS